MTATYCRDSIVIRYTVFLKGKPRPLLGSTDNLKEAKRIARHYADESGKQVAIKKVTGDTIENSDIPPGMGRAVDLYEAFTGHRANSVKVVDIPEIKKALAIGDVLDISYRTKRNGRVESYTHTFKASSRPLFAASDDGKTLLMIGGSFNFTERGIVDK